MSRTSFRWRLPDGAQEDTGCREAGTGSSRCAGTVSASRENSGPHGYTRAVPEVVSFPTRRRPADRAVAAHALGSLCGFGRRPGTQPRPRSFGGDMVDPHRRPRIPLRPGSTVRRRSGQRGDGGRSNRRFRRGRWNRDRLLRVALFASREQYRDRRPLSHRPGRVR